MNENYGNWETGRHLKAKALRIPKKIKNKQLTSAYSAVLFIRPSFLLHVQAGPLLEFNLRPQFEIFFKFFLYQIIDLRFGMRAKNLFYLKIFAMLSLTILVF